MTYDEIISKVSSDLNLPRSLVSNTFKAYWRVIREHITSLPLKEDLSEEDFLKLQPNVNIPSIGKLYITLDRYKRMKKQHEIFKNIKKNNVTHKED